MALACQGQAVGLGMGCSCLPHHQQPAVLTTHPKGLVSPPCCCPSSRHSLMSTCMEHPVQSWTLH